jgi:hypothetical protein
MRPALVLTVMLVAFGARAQQVRLEARVDALDSLGPPWVRGPGLTLGATVHLPYRFFAGAQLWSFCLWKTLEGRTLPFTGDSHFTQAATLRLDLEGTLGWELRLGSRVRLDAGGQAGVRVGYEAGTYSHGGDSVTISEWSSRFTAHALLQLGVRLTERLGACLALRYPLYQYAGEQEETSLISAGITWDL